MAWPDDTITTRALPSERDDGPRQAILHDTDDTPGRREPVTTTDPLRGSTRTRRNSSQTDGQLIALRMA